MAAAPVHCSALLGHPVRIASFEMLTFMLLYTHLRLMACGRGVSSIIGLIQEQMKRKVVRLISENRSRDCLSEKYRNWVHFMKVR